MPKIAAKSGEIVGLTSGRRHRICKTTSVLYSLLYGRVLFFPVHCFELLCLLFCKSCVFYTK